VPDRLEKEDRDLTRAVGPPCAGRRPVAAAPRDLLPRRQLNRDDDLYERIAVPRPANNASTLQPISIYDYPKYYDLIYGSDWKAEYDFLEACFRRHSERPVKRVFEPACGTGRLLVKLAAAGYQVAGIDLSQRAVDYCNARLLRHGFRSAATVANMADFRLPRQVDAAFNMINSFRHLTTAQTAEGHLQCMRQSIAKGGIYLLGLHLTPTVGQPMDEEVWAARRGHLAATCRVASQRVDRRRRSEYVTMTYDVRTPTRTLQIADQFVFRTYTRRQMTDLIRSVGGFQIVATYDFAYDLDAPIEVGAETEDVVYVLARR
jgi:SAM-dependent methyltransferase